MTTYTARGPLDLIALTPYLLGFHPADSVVVLTFGRKETFHARVDLPGTLEEQDELARQLCGVVARHEVPTVALLFYSEDVQATLTMARALVAGLGDGVRVLDAMRVEADCYYDALDPGVPGVPYDASAHPFTASRVFDGQVAHDSREALADTLVGTDEDDRDAVHRAAGRFADTVLGAAGPAWAAAAGDGAPARWLAEEGEWLVRTVLHQVAARSAGDLGVEPCGRLLLLLTQAPLCELACRTIDRDTAAAHVELWRGLVRRASEDLLPGPAALLAFAAWQAGDGALAWCAVDRCVAVDPDHGLAEVVADLLTRAVPPSGLAALRAG